jgi:rare lipoprotein A
MTACFMKLAQQMPLAGQFVGLNRPRWNLGLAAFLLACSGGAAVAGPSAASVHEPVIANPELDRSGHARRGKASFYAPTFAGRKMADGTRMHPQSNNAASKTLPLGTTAKVTNLETGRSALVVIRDRGPYIRGRIVDLSPSTAKEIGLDHKKGVTRVEVAPIVVPLADGSLKLVADARSLRSGASND